MPCTYLPADVWAGKRTIIRMSNDTNLAIPSRREVGIGLHNQTSAQQNLYSDDGFLGVISLVTINPGLSVADKG